jgi:hypothetical protein
VIRTQFPGPKGEPFCWYQCTIKGGREGRDLDVQQLVVAVEAMGARRDSLEFHRLVIARSPALIWSSSVK